MFPDVCTSILAACRHAEVGGSFIVDSELVAVDRADNNSLRTFQDLSTRYCTPTLPGTCRVQETRVLSSHVADRMGGQVKTVLGASKLP